MLIRILPLLILGAAALPAAADDLELADGSRFPGQVQSLSDGKLQVKTESAGTITVAWDKVRTLASDQRLKITVRDGTVYKGKISLEGESIEIREEGKPPVTLDRAQLTSLDSPEGGWSGTVNLSYAAEDGNSQSNKIFVSAEIIREWEIQKLLFRGHFLWGQEDGALSDQAGYAILKFDHRLSEEVYLLASSEIRTDRFEDLEYRSVTSVGAGYVFVKSKSVELWAEAGPAFIHEEIRDGTSDSWFGGRAAIHLNWKMPLGLELRDDATFYPNFETPADWQLHNEASLSTQLGEHWSLSGSVITDLDYRPLPGKSKYDDTYVIGLRFKF